MKSSWLLSFLFILFSGCVTLKPAGLTLLGAAEIEKPDAAFTLPGQGETMLFKATLDIKKHHLTGLLVIKRMDSLPPAVCRIVFANELGMTFFDLEMRPDTFRVVSCFESLNRKALMKILETDFRLLTGIPPVRHLKQYRQNSTGSMVLSGKAGRYTTWQTFSLAGDTLFSTAGKSTMADPAIITFPLNQGGFPASILIDNPVIGMKLSLRLLKR